MYTRILLPTDGSLEMSAVIDHAVSLAEIHGAMIQGVYVVDTGRFATLPVDSSWNGMSQMLREEGEEAIADLQERAGGDVTVEGTVLEGDPATRIVEFALETGCDAIVMGTHGRGGIDRLLLGSVAERVIRQSAVPVVTVPVGRAEGTGFEE